MNKGRKNDRAERGKKEINTKKKKKLKKRKEIVGGKRSTRERMGHKTKEAI